MKEVRKNTHQNHGNLMSIKVLILIVLTLSSVSCSLKLKLAIINNAGYPVSIYVEEKKYCWKIFTERTYIILQSIKIEY